MGLLVSGEGRSMVSARRGADRRRWYLRHRIDLPARRGLVRQTDDHRDTCDVADPISPSATVAILRLSDGLIEHLVLGDSVLVLDRADGAPLVVPDPGR
jgi:hypothetical protein